MYQPPRKTKQNLHNNNQIAALPATATTVTGARPWQRDLSSAAEMTHQRVKGRRRFYKHVSIREVGRSEDGDGGAEGAAAPVAEKGQRRWEVLLDSRVLKTPGRRPLEVKKGCGLFLSCLLGWACCH